MTIAEIAVPVPLFPLDKLFDYGVPEDLLSALTVGTLVTVPIGARKSWGIVTALKAESSEKKLKSVQEVRFAQPVFTKERMEFARWLSKRYFYPIGEVLETMLPAAIRKSSSKLLTKELKSKPAVEPGKNLELNDEQMKAFLAISQAASKKHLLWGVTGSGKTEVYLHLIEKNLEAGRGAMVLVPEIALTPQLFNRFEKAFPGQVAVFHSAQTEKELREEWLKVFFGKKRIALGPRSALFAPIADLGIVIVDEEHESSYKQEERLRYHGRVAAEKLSELVGATLVLGSATPSAETLQRGLSGQIVLHKLEKRAVEKARRPAVTVVDLKKNLAEKSFLSPPENSTNDFDLAPKSFFFTDELIVELENVLKNSEQAILFLNRRGLGRALVCKKCGYQPQCVQCAVNLVPHRTKMLCHYCGFECSIPHTCAQCQGELKEVGYGTQALEDELKRLFPTMKSLRLDRDVVQDRSQLVATLKDFADRKADVLIGTQMVAKGHDFPNVSLVGVVLADVGFFPDFRNEEKFFQLLTQVAGRAGRGEIPGKVILQTFRPDEKVFQEIQKGEDLGHFEKYVGEMLEARKFLHYPPFAELALVQFQGLEEKSVMAAATLVAQALQKVKKDDFIVLGAVPATISKVRNKYRFHVLVKSPNDEILHQALSWVQKTWEDSKLERKFHGTRMIIDIDPVQF